MATLDNESNRVRFTAGRVAAFYCPEGKSEAKLWDSEVRSLIIRARPSGRKAYYFQGRLNNKLIRMKIDDITERGITLEHARRKALFYQVMLKDGKDPRIEKLKLTKLADKERIEAQRQGVKFGKVLDGYIRANRKEWGESHLNDYLRSTLPTKRGRNGVFFELKDLRLEELNSSVLLAWIKSEKSHRPTATAKGYRLLRACLNWANTQIEYKDAIELAQLFNNTEIKKALPKPKAKQDSLDKQHLHLWFKAIMAINNPVIAACLQTLLLTGARREEILSLKRSDVDFKWKHLTIKDKIEGERIIPLTPYVATLLASLPRRNEWVFSSTTSTTGRLVEPYIAHAKALESAGLPKLSIHGLRRSFASLATWRDTPIGAVAQIQSYKLSATVEKYCVVRTMEYLQEQHNSIEKMILGFAGLEQPSES